MSKMIMMMKMMIMIKKFILTICFICTCMSGAQAFDAHLWVEPFLGFKMATVEGLTAKDHDETSTFHYGGRFGFMGFEANNPVGAFAGVEFLLGTGKMGNANGATRKFDANYKDLGIFVGYNPIRFTGLTISYYPSSTLEGNSTHKWDMKGKGWGFYGTYGGFHFITLSVGLRIIDYDKYTNTPPSYLTKGDETREFAWSFGISIPFTFNLSDIIPSIVESSSSNSDADDEDAD